ncbi:PadR family transcriptional regulator [Streptomyces sp. P38-E01]|uniref:PadR family transcriptional regulator n=1 Tax=Streptomyces tardus TaxID=2780544 RepID=A0A949JKP6_9ACTN|nr:PadR family transcriptional regulator [Streptomyces tardus]MBU7597984.1 PadR family transcriptional regulator [Streptomyces tardus]
MALRNAVLAALLDGEASGYELAKGFDASIANFWMATPQQLYRELARMESEGLLSARVVRQERRPDKRLFRLTDAGRAALREFAAAPPKPGTVRDELMIKVAMLDDAEPGAVRVHIEERAQWARAKLERYERLRGRLLDGRTEAEHFREGERVGPYLALLRGIAFEQDNLRWCELALTVLDAREAPGGRDDEANSRDRRAR